MLEPRCRKCGGERSVGYTRVDLVQALRAWEVDLGASLRVASAVASAVLPLLIRKPFGWRDVLPLVDGPTPNARDRKACRWLKVAHALAAAPRELAEAVAHFSGSA